MHEGKVLHVLPNSQVAKLVPCSTYPFSQAAIATLPYMEPVGRIIDPCSSVMLPQSVKTCIRIFILLMYDWTIQTLFIIRTTLKKGRHKYSKLTLGTHFHRC